MSISGKADAMTDETPLSIALEKLRATVAAWHKADHEYMVQSGAVAAAIFNEMPPATVRIAEKRLKCAIEDLTTAEQEMRAADREWRRLERQACE
jgi:hypothetical protein